jgi:hypothetical protein
LQLNGDRRRSGTAFPAEKNLQCSTPNTQWLVDEYFAVCILQHIEAHEERRRFARQFVDAALRRMKPHLKRIERECFTLFYDQFSVEDKAAAFAVSSAATTSGK